MQHVKGEEVNRPHADEGEVNAQLSAIRQALERLERQFERQNGRVGRLEKMVWGGFGAIVGLSGEAVARLFGA